MLDPQELERLRLKVARRAEHYVRADFPSGSLAHEAIIDYPTRPGKGIRPILCLAAAGAAGGDVDSALNTAAAIELLHNSFLIKDDLVDGSFFRRGDKTLHRKYGFEVALNAGDALKCIIVSPLLDNISVIGVRKSLEIVMEIERTASKSVEGQLLELTWIRQNATNLRVNDYYRMCEGKTCWYTVITPLRTGIIIGSTNAAPERLDAITRFGRYMGLAFQIRDDVLNLVGTLKEYGKEIDGDIREGKRTVMMIKLFEDCSPAEYRRVRSILAKPAERKTDADVRYIRDLMEKYGSIPKATAIAEGLAQRARRILRRDLLWFEDNRWTDLLLGICQYLLERNK